MPTQVLKRLNVESIVTLALPPRLLPSLCDQLLLAASRQSLLHLLLMGVEEEGPVVEALVEKGLWLHLEGLCGVPSSVWRRVEGHILSTSSQGNKLTYLGIYDWKDRGGDEEDREGDELNITSTGVKQLSLSQYSQLKYLLASIQHPHCPLTRLDLRDVYDVSDQDMEFLLGIIATTSIIDLGLRIRTPHTMKLLATSPALANLLILRPSFENLLDEETSKQLAHALSRSDCKVRFLDLRVREDFRASYWQLLLQSSSSRETNPLQALRIDFRPGYGRLQVRGGLADWLRSPECSLVWLHCIGHSADETEEWELANSLTNNFSVCTLAVLWNSLPAKAHASSLIRRNQLYKSGQLLEEEQVRPNVAKLFLCGHGTVGKTTLCKTLLATRRSAITSPLAACGLLSKPDRTRGMEFHSLSFDQGRRLVICDLAGQEEFHAFHHYFMNASNNDLFIVVCKLEEGSLQNVFERQLDYWLRFIVSHRCATDNSSQSSTSPTTYKPKVIVVVNFFYSAAVAVMRAVTHEKADQLMTKFSRDLDFGLKVQDASVGQPLYPSLFAIVAPKAGQVYPLKKRLASLLEELLKSGRRIPKLCHDISTLVQLPSRTKNAFSFRYGLNRSAKPPLFLAYSDVFDRYRTKFPRSMTQDIYAQRIQAALTELHNQGLLVYFPKHIEDEKAVVDESETVEEHAGNLVIADGGWFCNKLIGSLLGTNLDKGSGQDGRPKWKWRIQDIRDMLRKQGCEHKYLDKIIHYLQDLDLCFTTDDKCVIFPALEQEKRIEYPQPFFAAVESRDRSIGSSHMQVAFFGRRLRCEDSSMHLIPSGVFTRLQVKLQRLSDNDCYCLGNGWASLMKGKVGAVVRFGGENDEFWESKQWIDILICFHDSDVSSESSHKSSMLAGDRLMTQIKSLIYEICQAADFRGIPTVMLQEWVLQSKAPASPAIQLTTILKKVKEEGIENYHVAWPNHIEVAPTPVVELLLPKELQEHVDRQLTALATIRREFSLSDKEGEKMSISDESSSEYHPGDKSKGKVQSESDNFGAGELTGEHLQLWMLIDRGMHGINLRLDSVDQGMHGINLSLQMIRKDIGSLRECLRQAERNIIVNCSTRLLRHELTKDSAHPLYPHLVDTEGKLKALQSLFLKRSRLHFMCESPTDGPHPVQDQKGKVVTIEVKEWLAKTARVMVPAFRVICCMARLAATVYLPGSHVFIPSPAWLDELGLDREALQHEILPKALEALLKEVPNIDPCHPFGPELGSMIQKNEVKEAIKGILQEQTIDMATDFSLRRVDFGNEKVHWVCDKHIGAGTELRPISNPFK